MRVMPRRQLYSQMRRERWIYGMILAFNHYSSWVLHCFFGGDFKLRQRGKSESLVKAGLYRDKTPTAVRSKPTILGSRLRAFTNSWCPCNMKSWTTKSLLTNKRCATLLLAACKDYQYNLESFVFDMFMVRPLPFALCPLPFAVCPLPS